MNTNRPGSYQPTSTPNGVAGERRVEADTDYYAPVSRRAQDLYENQRRRMAAQREEA